MTMILKTSANGDIASGAEHWISEYSSKVPEFLQESKVTLGNVTVDTRFGINEDFVTFVVRTESLSFYEAITGYHAYGTQFRLNNTEDLGNLLLKTVAGECRFVRLTDVKQTIVYHMELRCKIITEGV